MNSPQCCYVGRDCNDNDAGDAGEDRLSLAIEQAHTHTLCWFRWKPVKPPNAQDELVKVINFQLKFNKEGERDGKLRERLEPKAE